MSDRKESGLSLAELERSIIDFFGGIPEDSSKVVLFSQGTDLRKIGMVTSYLARKRIPHCYRIKKNEGDYDSNQNYVLDLQKVIVSPEEDYNFLSL